MKTYIHTDHNGRIECVGTLAECLLSFFRYDGRAAEFARDEEGEMKLYFATRYVGGNAWTPKSPDTMEAWGYTSEALNPDDDIAVAAVAKAVCETDWFGDCASRKFGGHSIAFVEVVAPEAMPRDEDGEVIIDGCTTDGSVYYRYL